MTCDIRAIEDGRERFLDLLLLADPSQTVIQQYIATGYLFVLFEQGEAYGCIHLLPQSNEIIEIKNIAVKDEMQGCGYGKILLRYALQFCQKQGYAKVVVGTGNSSIGNFAFYQKAGFRFLAVIRDYFTELYEVPIYENGLQCRDMLLLEADLVGEK